MSDVDAELQKLKSLIDGIEVAMLTSLDDEGLLRARPMGTVEAPFDGTLWFFARASAGKTGDIAHDARVGVTYASRHRHAYVSLSGRARVIRDREEIAARWRSSYETWFPEGKDDPDLVLIAVTVEAAEYWDVSAVPTWSWVESTLSGAPPRSEDHTRIELRH